MRNPAHSNLLIVLEYEPRLSEFKGQCLHHTNLFIFSWFLAKCLNLEYPKFTGGTCKLSSVVRFTRYPSPVHYPIPADGPVGITIQTLQTIWPQIWVRHHAMSPALQPARGAHSHSTAGQAPVASLRKRLHPLFHSIPSWWGFWLSLDLSGIYR